MCHGSAGGHTCRWSLEGCVISWGVITHRLFFFYGPPSGYLELPITSAPCPPPPRKWSLGGSALLRQKVEFHRNVLLQKSLQGERLSRLTEAKLSPAWRQLCFEGRSICRWARLDVRHAHSGLSWTLLWDGSSVSRSEHTRGEGAAVEETEDGRFPSVGVSVKIRVLWLCAADVRSQPRRPNDTTTSTPTALIH